MEDGKAMLTHSPTEKGSVPVSRSWLRCLRTFLGELARPAADACVAAVVTPQMTAPDAKVAAHVTAARDALLRGDPDGCAEAAAEALELAPGDTFASFYLGQARLAQGRLGEARAAFAGAVERGDPFGLARGWLERVDARLAAVAPERLGRDSARAVEFERAARAALRQQAFEEARDLAAEAVRLDPTNLMAHHHLGLAWLGLGQRDRAIEAFAAARAYDGGLGLADGWIQQALAGAEPEQGAEP